MNTLLRHKRTAAVVVLIGLALVAVVIVLGIQEIQQDKQSSDPAIVKFEDGNSVTFPADLSRKETAQSMLTQAAVYSSNSDFKQSETLADAAIAQIGNDGDQQLYIDAATIYTEAGKKDQADGMIAKAKSKNRLELDGETKKGYAAIIKAAEENDE